MFLDSWGKYDVLQKIYIVGVKPCRDTKLFDNCVSYTYDQ